MKLPWSMPEAAYDPEPPPILSTWRRVYITTLFWLAFLILIFYAFTRYFA